METTDENGYLLRARCSKGFGHHHSQETLRGPMETRTTQGCLDGAVGPGSWQLNGSGHPRLSLETTACCPTRLTYSSRLPRWATGDSGLVSWAGGCRLWVRILFLWLIQPQSVWMWRAAFLLTNCKYSRGPSIGEAAKCGPHFQQHYLTTKDRTKDTEHWGGSK